MRRGIPHHLLDVLEPEKSYSAGEYSKTARPLLDEIAARGKVPVLVGGTGFYLRALIEGLPDLPTRDPKLRDFLLEREQRRPGVLHRLLRRRDPAAGRRIHANDLQKTVRALEITLLTQDALPPRSTSQPLENYRLLTLGLAPPREALVERLEQRAKEMFEQGLVEEVRALLEAGATGGEKPFESLGYKQCLQYIHGEITLAQAIELTAIETRQYAKRQLTWFRRDPAVVWLQGFGNEPSTLGQAAACTRNFLATFFAF